MGFPIPDTGAVTEDSGVGGGLLSTSGDINYLFGSDAGEWTAATLTGAYGSQLVIDTDGNWTYTADNANATIQALDSGQSITEVFSVSANGGNSTITITINGTDEPPCFVGGTLIDTPHGPRLIETLAIGDLVLTRDNGAQEIRWIGASHQKLDDPQKMASLAPVRITKGSFGPGIPERDLLLSPMHRVLVQNADIPILFGESEVFCPVGQLINGFSIRQDAVPEVSYYHMLFDQHEVLSSSGCASESFYPGQVGLGGFADETREELFTLFPDFRSMPQSYGQTARTVLRGYEAKLVRDRLIPDAPFLHETRLKRVG